MHVQLVIMSVVFYVKIESQVLHSPTRIDSFIQPWYSKFLGAVNNCRSLIFGEFFNWGSTGINISYQRLINLALPIDSDRLQIGHSDASFGFLRLSRCLFCARCDWNSWLHILLLARRLIPFPFFCAWSGCFISIWTALNGMETSLFFWQLLYIRSMVVWARVKRKLNAIYKKCDNLFLASEKCS